MLHPLQHKQAIKQATNADTTQCTRMLLDELVQKSKA
jgi:hypothetical protein